MKKINLIIICFIWFFSFKVFAIEKDISGSYECYGYDPFKKADYKGKMTISKIYDAYNFSWIYDENFHANGTGIVDKKNRNLIAVVFTSPSCPKLTGVQIFHLKSDGSLSGDWTLHGENQISTENCRKI